jgi:two-component system cell cycle sensor histidine kinase/response regulator CckA
VLLPGRTDGSASAAAGTPYRRDDRDMSSQIITSDAGLPLEDAAFLRAVLEAIPGFVVRIDPDQRISYINHLRAGVTLQQVMGQPVQEFIASEDFENYRNAAERALRTGQTCSYLARGSRSVTRRGPAVYNCHVVPLDNGDGRPAVCIVATDVTELLEHANALEQSQEKLQVAVDATGIGLWTWDLVQDRIQGNQRLAEILGCAPKGVAEYIASSVHPDDRESVREELEALRAGAPKFLEHRIVRPDGEVRWLLPCGRITRFENGTPVQVVGGTIDVTAQRRTAEHLRQAQKLDAVGSLSAGVAHNFNNMLAIIRPTLELALRAPRSELTPALEDALHAATRATDLIAQLMTFSRRRSAPAAVSLDLPALIERAASMCQSTFDRHVRIETVIEARSMQCTSDPVAIEQVIVNLLINARDAVAEAERDEPHIRLLLTERLMTHPERPGGVARHYACICVEDNGIGMTDAVKQRVFEPFFTTKALGKGTGLGLATSYAQVRDLGGFITIESQPHQRTSVAVFLPLTGSAPVVKSPTASRQSGARDATILVVDDESAVRRVIDLLLRECGHRVHTAIDGPDVIAKLDAGLCPDLILLDRSMPGWTPKQTLDAIRRRNDRVPIILFTGQQVTIDERVRVQDVLYKPVSNADFMRTIDHWLAAQRPPVV